MSVPLSSRMPAEVWWPHPGAAFDVIAIAASAGRLRALTAVFSELEADIPAGVTVVQHLDPRHRSLMAEILSRQSRLAVKQADDGDRLKPCSVYVAPPDRHLPRQCRWHVVVVENGTRQLSASVDSYGIGRLRPAARTCSPFALGKDPTWGALVLVEEEAAPAGAR